MKDLISNKEKQKVEEKVVMECIKNIGKYYKLENKIMIEYIENIQQAK